MVQKFHLLAGQIIPPFSKLAESTTNSIGDLEWGKGAMPPAPAKTGQKMMAASFTSHVPPWQFSRSTGATAYWKYLLI